MKRFLVCSSLCALFALPSVAETPRERVRRNSSMIYIHGITEELALAQIGAEGVPYLLELLRDPDFDRRDNVVAFLAYLAQDVHTPALVDFHRNPPVELVPHRPVLPRVGCGRFASKAAGVGPSLASARAPAVQRKRSP